MRATFFCLLSAVLGLAAQLAAAQALPRYLTTGRIVRQAPALDQVLEPGA